ncbi:MAG: glycosyltransferase family 2 protein [Candidatus Cloacimonadaceae bacterium]
MSISYVIPLLNEADSIRTLYKEIVSHNPAADYEIIFIDDGSKDDSYAILSEIAAQDERVRLVRFRRNFGKAAALQTGFGLAKGDYIFTLDADLQDDPAEIPKFLSKLEEGHDMVSGWKQKRHDPLYKTLPSRFFNFVASNTFRLKLKDFNCGFKLYKKEVVKEINLYGEMHRYIPALAHALGYRVGELAVNHRARIHGKSKYGVERYLRGFFDLLTVKMVTQYAKSPLYLFGRIGIVSIVFGIVLTGYLAFLKLFYGHPLTNRPLLFLGILMILAGLQFFSMGLICELIINRSQADAKQISIRETANLEPGKAETS